MKGQGPNLQDRGPEHTVPGPAAADRLLSCTLDVGESREALICNRVFQVY